ncbi:MAG TPA: outer membrane protein assembly factor BamA [Rectinema sp.]|nr:outer membrane protein assembly factor BamA [Rectinema sp.]HOE98260.1 outer membrane protein assembly factor BamA [Rectinema sp.]HPK78989.1 outer membrane protein assembly factor BamA [Rectinema sp.]
MRYSHKHFIVIIMIFCSFQIILAQTSTQELAGQDYSQDWFWNKKIAGFRWDGLHYANRNDLDSMLRDYIGTLFTENIWIEIQAKLYALDWFESIESMALPAGEEEDKIIIKFIVIEKPSINSIRVIGNSSIRTSELLDVASSKTGAIFNEDKAKADSLAMQKLYLQKGFPDARVEYEKTEVEGDSNLIILTFKVTEGTAVVVKKIAFSGISAFSSQTLKGQVTLKEAGLFQKGAFEESKLAESRTALEDYYASKGYIDAKVIDVIKNYSKDEKSQKNYLDITFVIAEGKQWKLGDIFFEGNSIFSTSRLASLISLKQNEPINLKRLLTDKQKIDDLYYESGYIFNTITMTEIRDEQGGRISFKISITERDRAHIESISFKGNTKTKDYVIARELPLEAGEVFSKAKIIDGLRNLYSLQYFSSIEPEIHQGSVVDLMDLVINVEEMSTAQIQFGLTLSGLGQPSAFPISGFIKFSDLNLGGTGKNLQVNMTLSPDEQSLETSFGQSWLFNKRISQSISFGIEHSVLQTAQDCIAPIFSEEDIPDPFIGLGSGSDEWDGLLSSVPDAYLMDYDDYSFSLGYSMGYVHKIPQGDVGIAGGVSSGLDMSSYDTAKYRPYEKEMRDYNGQWVLKDSIFGRVYLNRLDYWYNPGKGYFLSQRLTYTGILPMERQFYIRSDTRAEFYATLFSIPFSSSWIFSPVIGIHSGVQALLPQPWDSLAVTKDWVYIDGTFNVRGWKSLYKGHGILVWENWLELHLPIVPQVLSFDGFLDAGAMMTENGWLDMTLDSPVSKGSNALEWNNFAFSIGFGARFMIPQFPFRFYLAKRFVYDGSKVEWKTREGSFDFVLSITQPLY